MRVTALQRDSKDVKDQKEHKEDKYSHIHSRYMDDNTPGHMRMAVKPAEPAPSKRPLLHRIMHPL